jgi:antitoxin ParD1/3/4
MTITVHITPDIEKQVQENISLGDTDAVRRLLVEALEPTVDALMDNKSQLSVEEFEMKLDQLVDEFMACVGPDVPPLSNYAVSREGIYKDHSSYTPHLF